MLVHTTREAPADAEVISHQLMLRAGMIKQVAAGIYTILPLGFRVLKKVEDIVRQEMDRAGAQELLMPALNPAELWMESGRWNVYGKELIRLKDRRGRDFCLGPTHEELITDLVRREIRSYRDLPLNLYQIQTKFRDEHRPRFGIMRGREFLMKDAYSFDTDEEGAQASYDAMYEAYKRIFERCGLRFRAVEADSGPIGGSFSHEFMVLADAGEDEIAHCQACGYASNIDKAEAVGEDYPADLQLKPLKKVLTPDMKTVEEVCDFLGLSPQNLVKTMLYMADDSPLAVLVRGDHSVNETKLTNLTAAQELRMADGAAIQRITGGPEGFSGPVGLENIRIIADLAIKGMRNFVTGANEKDHHLINVNMGRDFKIESFHDLRPVQAGDPCPKCGAPLTIEKGIEVGHVFKLGTKYSEALKATFQDHQGREKFVIMGCYGIGVGRTMAASIEQNNDPDGIIWPVPIAPYHVYILPVSMKDEKVTETAENIYSACIERGLEALIDDREERAGGKFKDADLLGIPYRVTVGPKNLAQGKVELNRRADGSTDLVETEGIVDALRQEITAALESYK
jgi:prolyl-tRNA synthetase